MTHGVLAGEMPGPVPAVDCCDADMRADGHCACGPTERILRAWIDERLIVPMTPEQREWALDQINQVEGFERAEHETETDGQVARTVISAWADFCRDKGML